MCCIAHGVVECYYLMNGDLRKDSNMNITLMQRTIEVAQKILDDRQHMQRATQSACVPVAGMADGQEAMELSVAIFLHSGAFPL